MLTPREQRQHRHLCSQGGTCDLHANSEGELTDQPVTLKLGDGTWKSTASKGYYLLAGIQGKPREASQADRREVELEEATSNQVEAGGGGLLLKAIGRLKERKRARSNTC